MRLRAAQGALAGLAALVFPALAAGQQASKPIVPVVSTETVEVHYRVVPASLSLSRVELWYTTDEGRSWWSHGLDADCAPPAIFRAPRDGLYGFFVVATNDAGASSLPPGPGTPPHTQCLVDQTPPVVQLHDVLKSPDFATSRLAHISWSSYDAHPTLTPISLYYRERGSDLWTVIESGQVDTKGYDWRVPTDIDGPIRVKIAVVDRGGSVTERAWVGVLGAAIAGSGAPPKTATTLPELTARIQPTTQPGPEPPPRRQAALATQLYEAASWHLVRGELDLATARLGEALKLDQTLLDARTDLAGIALKRGDYGKAMAEYQRVLAIAPSQPEALTGLARTYAARRDYSQARGSLQRLLLVRPDDAAVWLQLGDVSELMGQRGQARSHWLKAMQVDGKASEVIGKARERLETMAARR